jgi:hypothetical protein
MFDALLALGLLVALIGLDVLAVEFGADSRQLHDRWSLI